VDDLQGAFRVLAKNVAAAQDSTSHAAQAFRALNINLSDGKGGVADLNTIFLRTADAFSQFEAGATKAADAQIILGRSGENLIPVMDQSAKGLQELFERADKLGFTIDQHTAEAASRFNDKLRDMKDIWLGLATSFSAHLEPALTTLENKFLSLNDKIQPFRKAFDAMESGINTAGAAWSSVFGDNGVIAKTGDYIGKMWDNAKSGNITGIFKDTGSYVKNVFTGVATDIKEGVTKGVDGADEKLDEFHTNLKKKAAPAITFDGESLKQQLDEVYQELDKRTTVSTLAQTQRFNEMANNWKGSTKSIATNFYHLWDDMDAAGQQGAQGIQGDLEQFFLDPAKEGFKGLAMSFIKTIEEMLAKAAAAQLLSTLFGGTGAGGASGGLGGIFSSFLTYGSSVAGGRASGGNVTGGATYVVGENGPELFTPSGNGAIAAHGMGGSSFNHTYYIDAKGADADRVQAMMPSIMENTRAATKRDILDAFRRSHLPAPRFA
jgi:hypothetical protein